MAPSLEMYKYRETPQTVFLLLTIIPEYSFTSKPIASNE